MVTQDQDFLRLHQSGVEHAGIVFTRHGSRSIGEMIAHLELMHQFLEAVDVRGKVEYF